jgi:hypothetical protein
MSGMRDAVQEYADAGGDMGLIKGTEEQIKRKLGIDSGKASALAVQLWREFQTYRLNMTGAAFTEKESRDYAAVNPTLGKSLNLNLSVINGAINQLSNRIIQTIDSRVPGASKIYNLANNVQPKEMTNMSDDDAYNEYLKTTGQQIPEDVLDGIGVNLEEEQVSLLPDFSGYQNPFNFNIFTK